MKTYCLASLKVLIIEQHQGHCLKGYKILNLEKSDECRY